MSESEAPNTHRIMTKLTTFWVRVGSMTGQHGVHRSNSVLCIWGESVGNLLGQDAWPQDTDANRFIGFELEIDKTLYDGLTHGLAMCGFASLNNAQDDSTVYRDLGEQSLHRQRFFH